jgi:hypothetical protein
MALLLSTFVAGVQVETENFSVTKGVNYDTPKHWFAKCVG